jgi:hypothetical protein
VLVGVIWTTPVEDDADTLALSTPARAARRIIRNADREGVTNVQTSMVTWTPDQGWSQALDTVPARTAATLALVFADPQVDSAAALNELQHALPAAVIGCSTAGQFLGNRIDIAPVVALIVAFDSAQVASTFECMEGRDADDVGAAMGRSLTKAAAGQRIAGVIVMAGGLTINGSALVNGLTRTLPPAVSLCGALAGDGPRFQNTWVYGDGHKGEDCVAAAAIIGESVTLRHGSQGGWDGFGPRRTITASHGNVLLELDGQPALDLYIQYLGERSRELPSSALLFPLSIQSPDGATNLVRTVLSVNEDDRCMTFAGDVPQGWSARLMWTTMDRLMEGATDAAHESAQESAGLAIAVSCVGRRLVLGDRSEEELDAVQDVLGDEIPLVGLYSYGEIAPHHGTAALHNQTMTITTIAETAGP